MKKPLRIGIEVQRLFRVKKHGMEVVALEILRELQQLDTINHYFIFVKDDKDSECLQETENFKIVKLHGKTYFDWEQVSLPKAVKSYKLDFLHSTCNTSALNISVPLILTLHDIIYLEKLDFKGTAYQNFGNIYRKLVVPKVVKKARLVITVSKFEAGVISKRLPIATNKLEVVYNGVSKKFNSNFTSEQISNFKSHYGLPDDFILFLGNTAPKKNTPNLVKAYAIYCETAKVVTPLVILDYSRELVLDILRKINKVSAIENIKFPGFVPSGEMPKMYNAAMLFIYPSLRESFGLPILEAMSCNTPVITSNTSCMPEIASNAAILINPAEPADIAEKILSVISNADLRQTLSKLGLKRVEQFSWKKAAEESLAIYSNIL
ncbi:glycosyltransferase family 1 protein [Pedobacter sp. Leaf170]|uniref:glycosyltransferase family 4 protein n=1 Tax=Pedobacter sp. Leaf170 TaxID=2876558 RepID=UPI001E2F1739|nr:glycosyltransferase family 1 protein [Pedobacter sp. Leaf170]